MLFFLLWNLALLYIMQTIKNLYSISNMWLLNKIQKTISGVFNKKSYYNNNLQSLSSLLSKNTLSIQTYYELYRNNWDIRQAIKKIANWVARNGIYLQDNNRKTIENNVITDEVYSLFQTPTFLKFKTDLYRNYLLSWELYVLPLFNVTGKCIWFDVIDSRSVSKTVDEYGVIRYFTVTSWWKMQQYQPDQLAYFKYEDDTNSSVDWMWVLNWVVYDALSDLSAQKTNYSFYENSAIPSAILILDEWMSVEEMQNAKDMFMQQFQWTANQHKTLVAWWIKDIKTIALSPRDMEFINQRHLTTEKISACFGVPKLILWYVDNINYSNWDNQRKEFIEWTLRPFETDFEHICNKLLEMFRPDLFDKLRVKADWEQLEESQERMEWLRKDVQNWILTINEARIERWLDELQDENANKPLVSRNAVLLEDIWLDAVLPLNEV